MSYGKAIIGQPQHLGHLTRSQILSTIVLSLRQIGGIRRWTRKGLLWEESDPSGARNLFQIQKKVNVQGKLGTIASSLSKNAPDIFIPDLTEKDSFIYVITTEEAEPLGLIDDLR